MDFAKLLNKEQKLNHEVRFRCSKDTKQKTKSYFNDFFRGKYTISEFQRLIFIAGLETFEEELNKIKQKNQSKK